MNDSDFSGLASLIETAGLTDDLEETGPFTVFGMHSINVIIVPTG
jgi:uncharacterized surface protein with fasciclin (FAS1) repeats